MSDFLNKAKDMAEGLKDKMEEVLDSVDDKLPAGIKEKVDAVRAKVDDVLPGHADETPAADAASAD